MNTTNTTTANIKFRFVSRRGNKVDVIGVHVISNHGPIAARGAQIRSFARVCGVDVPCPAAFQAPDFVHAAGF